MTDVCLVSMPYSAIEHPSIALGILRECLDKANIDVTTVYGNILFAELVGLNKYIEINSLSSEELIGEWVFSGCAFPDFHPDHEAFFDLMWSKSDELIDLLWEMRTQAELFIHQLADMLLAKQPRIVGCTSTFQQNCASLALLRRIKELAPEVITMMGGANCESIMGVTLKREFPWVDYVVSGEAEEIIGDFFHLLLESEGALDPTQFPHGVIGATPRRPARSLSVIRESQPPRAIVKNLKNSPTPSYDDYFTTLSQTSLQDFISPGLLIETSRGCWWGQKHHCTFCGLNGMGMGYRSKAPEHVKQEMAALASRYGIHKFEVVDNILDMSYLDTVLPHISSLEKKYTLFFETKANLKRSQLQRLSDAGVLWLQPGIESLHDEFLKLIDKGTTALINLQLLKWCREYGIRLFWNILVGAPGERDEWYGDVASWLPMIVHLQPPMGSSVIRYDRFSPYFMQAEKYGIRLTPLKRYSYIYPLEGTALFDLVYFFEDDNKREANENATEGNQGHEKLKELVTLVDQWKQLFWQASRPILIMYDSGASMRIMDTRPCATRRVHVLEGLACEVYRACDGAISVNGLTDSLRKAQPDLSWEDVMSVIDRLKQDKLLLEINGKFLSLAVKNTFRPLPKMKDFVGGYINVPKMEAANK